MFQYFFVYEWTYEDPRSLEMKEGSVAISLTSARPESQDLDDLPILKSNIFKLAGVKSSFLLTSSQGALV